MSAKKVLIVEDDPILLEGLDCILRDAGFRTLLAGDGSQALDILRENSLDLILTDIGMKPMSGRDFVRIKNESPTYKDIRTIIVSGEIQAADLVEVQAVVSKPFHPKKLIETIGSVLMG